MLLSDYLKNGSTLQGVAGSAAINTNDLLLLNAIGNLYPVAVSDLAATANAGAALMASTLVQSTNNLTSTGHKEVFVSPIDGGVYLAYPQLANNSGLTLVKYTAAGALVKSVPLIGTANALLNNPVITQLSNGNILVAAAISASGPGIYYAVFDQNLNQVFAATNYATPNTVYVDAIALSGGGFALAYPMGTGIFRAIFDNAGNQVTAGAAINGSPIAGGAVKMAQLSNGNIAYAINSSTAGQALGYAITTAAGAGVVNYTVLNSATSAGSVYPAIAQMAGFFACIHGDGANTKGYVINNAGAVQGGSYSVANTNTSPVSAFSDGAGFWFAFASSSSAHAIVYAPTTGVGYVVNTTNVINYFTAFIDRGFIVMMGTTNLVVTYKLNANGLGTVSRLADVALTGTFGQQTIVPGGDFTLACFSWTNNMYLGLYKYMSAAIVGVSQVAVAANSSGTAVPFSMGPGGYPCNQVNGTIGKGFDHSATNIIGNKGAILGQSASLKGI